MSDKDIVFGDEYDLGGVIVTDKGSFTNLGQIINDQGAANTKTRSTGSARGSSGGSFRPGSAQYPKPAPINPISPPLIPAPQAIANFSYTVSAGYRVDFINTSFNATKFVWDFGDGKISLQKHPIHFYATTGSYTTVLTAYNSAGQPVELTAKVVIKDVNEFIDFTYVKGGLTVFFNDVSSIVNADVSEWNFNDGTTSTEHNPTHVFPGNGAYNVTLKRGAFTVTKQVIVNSQVVLLCDPADGADGYVWEVSTNSGASWVEVADTVIRMAGVSLDVHGIDPSGNNLYRVKTYNAVGESDYSNVVAQQCE